METLGQFLKREREFRRVSLEEVSRAIKNNVSLLESLEADRMDNLPKGIFLKGLLRSYCQMIGVSFDEVASRYPDIFETAKKVVVEVKKDSDILLSEKGSPKSQILWVITILIVGVVLALVLTRQ